MEKLHCLIKSDELVRDATLNAFAEPAIVRIVMFVNEMLHPVPFAIITNEVTKQFEKASSSPTVHDIGRDRLAQGRDASPAPQPPKKEISSSSIINRRP